MRAHSTRTTATFCTVITLDVSDGVKDMTHEAKAKAMTHNAKAKLGQGPDLSCSAKTTNTLHCSMLIQVNLENSI